ncbi:MAG: hypothetical protein U1A78_20475 [Polyangia bacterium]
MAGSGRSNGMWLRLGAGLLGLLLGLGTGAHDSDAGEPCARKLFLSQLVEGACKSGGQQGAKKAMKRFIKQAKKRNAVRLSCKTCHSRLAPTYDLRPEGHRLFTEFGGQ